MASMQVFGDWFIGSIIFVVFGFWPRFLLSSWALLYVRVGYIWAF